MKFDPRRQLEAGVAILDPLMADKGFSFTPVAAGTGSGGHFACGSYIKGNRRLELHYRWGLGIVRYHIGEHSLDHAHYMRLLGKYSESQWVRVTMDKTLDGFHRLLYDLRNFCQDFLSGNGEEFLSLADRFAQDPGIFSGPNALGR